MKKRGRKRQEFCAGTSGVVHRLTDETRLWKTYVDVNGLPRLMSNGCAECNRLNGARRDRLATKLRRCGVSA